MLIVERVVALGATPTFSALPDHVLAQIAQVVTEVTYHEGEAITEEGNDESWMFVLVDGAVTVKTNGTTVAELEPGAVIGELAALDPAPRSATVVARRACHLLRLEHRALEELMIDHPVVTAGLLSTLVRRLRDTNQQLVAADVAQ